VGHSVGRAIAEVEGGVVAAEVGGFEAAELEVDDDAGEPGPVDEPEDAIELVTDVVGFLVLPEQAPSINEVARAATAA